MPYTLTRGGTIPDEKIERRIRKMRATDVAVTLREITAETLRSVLKLEVAEEQKKFVASNAVSIAQAHFSKYAWFRAIYADDTPVGFVMLYLDQDKPLCGIWRFMVDEDHQRKGYGSKAMRQVIEYVKSLPKAEELLVSYAPGEGDPSPFYKKCGFVETGEWEGGEKVMKLVL
jgi:diamine N-acetyltransferase